MTQSIESGATDVHENATPMIQSIGRSSVVVVENALKNDLPMTRNIESGATDVTENATPITERRSVDVNANATPMTYNINSVRH
ncbi:MAG: hypothetical protein EBV86_12220 [Marivivens sp.]|nr:hypothetical protein [Marivivens sp.]